MFLMESRLCNTAMDYIEAHGQRANLKIGDDISRAIGTSDWNEAHRLQRTQSKIRKLQLCGKMSEELTADKKNSYSI